MRSEKHSRRRGLRRAGSAGPAPLWGEIAVRIAAAMTREDFSRGDLAALRRMDPDAPDAAVFWRLLALHELSGSPAVESKWALILHGVALMTNTSENRSAHSGTMRVGRALFLGGEESRDSPFFSEQRLNRLLTARGPMMRTLLARMFRMMGTRPAVRLAGDGEAHPLRRIQRRPGGRCTPPNRSQLLRSGTTIGTDRFTVNSNQGKGNDYPKISSDPHAALLSGSPIEP